MGEILEIDLLVAVVQLSGFVGVILRSSSMTLVPFCNSKLLWSIVFL